MKRKKRLEKGILSIKIAIEIHQKRRDEAIAQGKIELAQYLDKEVKSLKKRLLDRERKLIRK